MKNQIVYERVNLDTLEEDRIITLKKDYYPSLLGDFSIELSKNKGVRVHDVTCPNHTCINQGWVNICNLPIICIPNDVRIKIVSDNQDIVIGEVDYERKYL